MYHVAHNLSSLVTLWAATHLQWWVICFAGKPLKSMTAHSRKQTWPNWEKNVQNVNALSKAKIGVKRCSRYGINLYWQPDCVEIFCTRRLTWSGCQLMLAITPVGRFVQDNWLMKSASVLFALSRFWTTGTARPWTPHAPCQAWSELFCTGWTCHAWSFSAVCCMPVIVLAEYILLFELFVTNGTLHPPSCFPEHTVCFPVHTLCFASAAVECLDQRTSCIVLGMLARCLAVFALIISHGMYWCVALQAVCE